jgi:hypothetical protein
MRVGGLETIRSPFCFYPLNFELFVLLKTGAATPTDD